jgi:hypothetical protein
VPADALTPEEIAELRAQIIGNFQPVLVVAAVNRQAPRTVYATLAKHPDIPTIKVGDQLYLDPLVYATERARPIRRTTPQPEPESLPSPRRPGRPRKVRL